MLYSQLSDLRDEIMDLRRFSAPNSESWKDYTGLLDKLEELMADHSDFPEEELLKKINQLIEEVL